MAQETGWHPLPLTLKIIFVVMVVGVILNLGILRTAYASGMILFSFMILGYGAVIIAFVLNVLLTFVLLNGLWKRSSWAGYFGMALFGFLALNSALGFINLQGNLEKAVSKAVLQPNVSPEQMLSGALLSMHLLLISGIVLNLFFFYLVYRARKYFL